MLRGQISSLVIIPVTMCVKNDIKMTADKIINTINDCIDIDRQFIYKKKISFLFNVNFVYNIR